MLTLSKKLSSPVRMLYVALLSTWNWKFGETPEVRPAVNYCTAHCHSRHKVIRARVHKGNGRPRQLVGLEIYMSKL